MKTIILIGDNKLFFFEKLSNSLLTLFPTSLNVEFVNSIGATNLSIYTSSSHNLLLNGLNVTYQDLVLIFSQPFDWAAHDSEMSDFINESLLASWYALFECVSNFSIPKCSLLDYLNSEKISFFTRKATAEIHNVAFAQSKLMHTPQVDKKSILYNHSTKNFCFPPFTITPKVYYEIFEYESAELYSAIVIGCYTIIYKYDNNKKEVIFKGAIKNIENVFIKTFIESFLTSRLCVVIFLKSGSRVFLINRHFNLSSVINQENIDDLVLYTSLLVKEEMNATSRALTR